MAPKKTPTLRRWLNLTDLEARDVPATLIDHDSNFRGSGDNSSVVLGQSDNGRYAIFSSLATNLVDGQVDTPSTKDLFWTDLVTGEVKLVTNLPTAGFELGTTQTSYNYDGSTTYSFQLGGNADSFDEAVISGDGQFVAFTSRINASLVDPLYITKAISPGASDIQRTIVPDRNDTFDVFRWEAQTRATGLASRTYYNPDGFTQLGVQVAGTPTDPNRAFGTRVNSVNPAISTDGSRVSFVSKFDASEVLPQRTISLDTGLRLISSGGSQFYAVDDGDTSNDIFLTDFVVLDRFRQGGGTVLQENVNEFATTVMSKVATTDFTIQYFDFINFVNVPGDTFTIFETFGSKSNQPIGVDPLGRYLGGDGLTATFVSDTSASLLSTNFTFNRNNRRTYADSTRANAYWTQFGSTSDDSNIVRLVTSGATIDPTTPTATPVPSTGSGGGVVQNAIISALDPTGVLFAAVSGSTPLVAGFSGDSAQLYFRHINGEIGDATILVSAISGSNSAAGNAALPTVTANGVTVIDPTSYQVSDDGTAAVFTSAASNIIPTTTVKDANKATDIFVKDLADPTGQLTTLPVTAVSIRPAASATTKVRLTGASAATTPYISVDGRFVTFQSAGTDYAAAGTSDTNAATDIFVVDRTTTPLAVNYASTVPNRSAAGNAASSGGFVGNAGTVGYVVFTSSSTNLDPQFPIAKGNTDAYATSLPLGGVASTDPPLQASRIGAVSGGSPAAVAYVSSGSSNQLVVGDRFSPFPGFTGEIRVATADFNNDGNAQPDLIAAAGPGIAPRVVVIDGATGKTIFNQTVFEASFTGGLNVTAADINSDGFADIIVGADIGGGPRIKIISGANGNTIADFFVFETSFRGGVRLATGNIGSIVNGTGQVIDDLVPDIIAGAGVDGGPRVSVLDGASAAKNQIARITDFFAFELSLRNGVYVSAGDFNKDTFDDIVAGGGPGGGPRVQVFDTKSSVATPDTPGPIVNFFAFSDASRNGVRVAAKNVDGDAVADILVGEGAGNSGRIRSYSGGNLDSTNQPTLIDDTIVFDDFASTNGAWVG